MMKNEFKEKVIKAMLAQKERQGYSDANHARILGINKAVYSRLKKGDLDKTLAPAKWMQIAQKLQVHFTESKWKVARTQVYNEIEETLTFCQRFSKSMILVDDCGIGKTFCAKHVIHGLHGGYYLDCSQAKNKQRFIRELAGVLGVETKGRLYDVLSAVKFYLNAVKSATGNKPIIVLDEAGDLDYPAFLELKSLWNATEGTCGWYLMGADGLGAKVERGINHKKVGYAEIFSRFSDAFLRFTPRGKEDKESFWKQLLGEVAMANMNDGGTVNKLISKCIASGKTLRGLQTMINISEYDLQH